MTTQMDKTATDQPASPEELIQSPAVQQKFAQIRAHLPGLAALNDAFAELHDLLDEHELAGNFEACCQRQFGVNPELLRDAAEHP